jgi:hypothetical protein
MTLLPWQFWASAVGWSAKSAMMGRMNFSVFILMRIDDFERMNQCIHRLNN